MEQISTVYRVQDQDGRGPWKPGFSHVWVEDRPDHDNLTPWFSEFGMIHRKCMTWEHMGCGCATLEQLRRWFTKSEYATLQRLGYRAVEIKVSRVLGFSGIQCVFTTVKPLKEIIGEVTLY